MCDGRGDIGTTQSSSGANLVTVRGEVDVGSSPTVRRRLLQAAHAGPLDLVVDLTETSFLDCSGMAAIAAARDVLRVQKRDLRLRGAHGVVARAIRMTDLAGLLEESPRRTARQ